MIGRFLQKSLSASFKSLFAIFASQEQDVKEINKTKKTKNSATLSQSRLEGKGCIHSISVSQLYKFCLTLLSRILECLLLK